MITPGLIEFLLDNKMHNSTQWFHEHHDDYERLVRQPLTLLATELYGALESVDPLMTNHKKPSQAISRINRDIRFSNDKTIYKDHLWISIKRDKKAYPLFPEFFVGIDPDYWCCGCGYYKIFPESLATYRQLILDDDKSFKKAAKAFKKSDFYFYSSAPKRSKFPDQPPEKRQWLDLKEPTLFYQSEDAETLFSDGFAQAVIDKFMSVKDVYKFFVLAEEKTRTEFQLN